jgi:tRNA A37 N6-isopentenylltransferase MiaA
LWYPGAWKLSTPKLNEFEIEHRDVTSVFPVLCHIIYFPSQVNWLDWTFRIIKCVEHACLRTAERVKRQRRWNEKHVHSYLVASSPNYKDIPHDIVEFCNLIN